MSKIVTKAFDATKKVVRSIFRGSPNLLTSSDLNRQFEALKHQIDEVENKAGCLSDLTVSASVQGDNLKVVTSYSHINCRGCYFSGNGSSVEHIVHIGTPFSGTVYVCLYADTKRVTYSDDFSHEISGAKFEDGSSMPAADNIVYTDETLQVVFGTPDESKCIFILSKISLNNNKEGDPLAVQMFTSTDKHPNVSALFNYVPDTDPTKVKGNTTDYALSAFIEAFKSIGNTTYKGECKWAGLKGNIGTWKAVLVGKLMFCWVNITDTSVYLFSGEKDIVLDGFDKWQFLEDMFPVSQTIRLTLTKRDSAETLILRDNDFPNYYFSPQKHVQTGGDSPDDEDLEIEGQKIGQNYSCIANPGVNYRGSKNYNEFRYGDTIMSNDHVCFSFTALVWNHKNSTHNEKLEF